MKLDTIHVLCCYLNINGENYKTEVNFNYHACFQQRGLYP